VDRREPREGNRRGLLRRFSAAAVSPFANYDESPRSSPSRTSSAPPSRSGQRPSLRASEYPMMLAETASIFGETVVFEKATADWPRPNDSAARTQYPGPTQTVVDISPASFSKALRTPGPASCRTRLCLHGRGRKGSLRRRPDQLGLHPTCGREGHYYDTDSLSIISLRFRPAFRPSPFIRYRGRSGGSLRRTGRHHDTDGNRRPTSPNPPLRLESREFGNPVGIIAGRIATWNGERLMEWLAAT
jgi:hypothetical protein